METVHSASVEQDTTLSSDTLDAMEELGDVLKIIFLRMKREGYAMVDSKIVKINENENE
ncbi:hypothetical protein H6781_00990 [Candidatus Nomurabacteria bacterium]|nr:hypothetical protein [Candidatus Kaiserbacteria bacterium]MCB9810158.1 hypothetical protein [Candidatus Nomurabacteria bacterium]MCB9818266.1 hypothetical protein [Candidatus Nomurabacteria bacterium]